MQENIPTPMLQIPNPFGQVRREEVLHEVFRERVKVRWVGDAADDDFFVEFYGVCGFAVEGWVSISELGVD